MTELSRVPGTQTCGAGKTRGPSAGGCRHPLRAAGFPWGGHRPGSLPLSGHQQDTGGEPGHTLCGPALSSPNSSLFPTGSPYRQHGWREPGDWGAAAPATQGAGGADSPLCRASRQDGRRGSCGDRHAEASPRHGPGQASSQTGFPRREWAARRRACATAADPSPASANAAPQSVPGARGGRTRTPLSRRSGNSDAARGPRRGAPGRVAAPAERKSRGYCRRLLPTGTRGHGDSPYSFSFCSPRTLSPKNQNDGFPCRGKDAHLLPGRASAGE